MVMARLSMMWSDDAALEKLDPYWGQAIWGLAKVEVLTETEALRRLDFEKPSAESQV